MISLTYKNGNFTIVLIEYGVTTKVVYHNCLPKYITEEEKLDIKSVKNITEMSMVDLSFIVSLPQNVEAVMIAWHCVMCF